MPKIGQNVKYHREGVGEVAAAIVALSKDCKTQIVEPCPSCGTHGMVRREVPTHDSVKPDDKTTVELVELDSFNTKDEKGNTVVNRRIVGGRAGVPMARSLKEFLATPNTWLPESEEE
jgi:hypothetical protein